MMVQKYSENASPCSTFVMKGVYDWGAGTSQECAAIKQAGQCSSAIGEGVKLDIARCSAGAKSYPDTTDGALGGLGCEKAYDGDLCTQWTTGRGSEDAAWLELTFDEPSSVTSMRLRQSQTAGSGTNDASHPVAPPALRLAFTTASSAVR